MNIKKALLNLLLFAFILGGTGALCQQPVLPEDDLYIFFGAKNDFLFLQNINQRIEESRKKQDVTSLCAYAALLFYAEHLSGKRHEMIDGISVLKEAASIAWEKQDVRSLTSVQIVWGSKFFGLNDAAGADEIGKYIQNLKSKDPTSIKKDTPVKDTPVIQTPLPLSTATLDAQKFLMAEEYARLDAVEQIAESIFGVMIQSVTDVKNFSTVKDVVVSELKSSLLIGAKFGTTEIKGDEVRVPVVVAKDQIIASMSMALGKKSMSSKEKKAFEQSLQNEYKAVGTGFMK